MTDIQINSQQNLRGTPPWCPGILIANFLLPCYSHPKHLFFHACLRVGIKMMDASSLYQHFPTATKPIISRDKPVLGYISYQNVGKEEFKMVLDLAEVHCCKLPKAI